MIRQIFFIAWIAVRELLYERVFYLLLAFAALALGLSVLLGSMTYAEQAKLTIDFMLGGLEIAMVLFSIFMSISLFQRELQLGSVAMILSKPISRTSFLLGKFIGQMVIQGFVAACMAIMTNFILWRIGEGFSAYAVSQAVFLIYLEALVMASATYFFAVNAGGTTSAAASLFLFTLGHLTENITAGVKGTDQAKFWPILRSLIPNFEVFNSKALASYALFENPETMRWSMLYALVCMTTFLILAALCFNRRDILT